MQQKVSLLQTLLISGLVGIILSIVLILLLVLALSIQSLYAKPVLSSRSQALESPAVLNNAPLKVVEAPGLPIRLKIPVINVDAAIEHVGLTNKGAMAVPKGSANAAWLNLWPRPGEKGSAIIAGHFGWKNNLPAVFDNLHKLQRGDMLYIEDEKGAIITFTVREIRSFRQDNEAPEVFSSNDGQSHLNLITCEGLWDVSKKSYPSRLIVFTDQVL